MIMLGGHRFLHREAALDYAYNQYSIATTPIEQSHWGAVTKELERAAKTEDDDRPRFQPRRRYHKLRKPFGTEFREELAAAFARRRESRKEVGA